MKRAREVNEAEAPRKKSSQGSRQANTTECEEMMTLVVCTMETLQISGESSKNLPNYPWTREYFKLPETRKDLEKLSQEIQKATLPLTNLMLSQPKLGSTSVRQCCRGMDSDTYAQAKKQSIRVEETIGQIGVHLSQVCKNHI